MKLFFTKWLLANIIAWSISGLILSIAGEFILGFSAFICFCLFPLCIILLAIVSGTISLFVGIAQTFVLNRYGYHFIEWAWATILGGSIGGSVGWLFCIVVMLEFEGSRLPFGWAVLSDSFQSTRAILIFAISMMGSIGIAQQRILRLQGIPTTQFMITNLLSGLLGWSVSIKFGRYYLIHLFDQKSLISWEETLGNTILLLIVGSIYGLFTGIQLIKLITLEEAPWYELDNELLHKT